MRADDVKALYMEVVHKNPYQCKGHIIDNAVTAWFLYKKFKKTASEIRISKEWGSYQNNRLVTRLLGRTIGEEVLYKYVRSNPEILKRINELDEEHLKMCMDSFEENNSDKRKLNREERSKLIFGDPQIIKKYNDMNKKSRQIIIKINSNEA